MIREFTIENFKSIESLTLPLGRVTVLIGENGAGKSNVLEAMAFFGAAVQDKLDPEFLYARGVRGCSRQQTLSGFESKNKSWQEHSFHLGLAGDTLKKPCHILISDHCHFDRDSDEWALSFGAPNPNEVLQYVTLTRSELAQAKEAVKTLPEKALSKSEKNELADIGALVLRRLVEGQKKAKNESRRAQQVFTTPFVIFSPENTALRTFESEGQMRPLGVRGEGLFKLVQHFAEHQPAKFKLLRNELKLFDWFEDFAIPKRLGIGESRLDIKDRFLAAKRLLDQRSANEGFLFLLFYLCLFLSPQTPKFFAIDNIDASLNPKLCAEMMRRLVALAKQEDKQVVITTHNPAILDGLDLSDKEQMLYAIQRNEKGRTIAQRIPAPKPLPGEPALKLSHAYLRGLLGGVPKNF